jgi:hypothetical protein
MVGSPLFWVNTKIEIYIYTCIEVLTAATINSNSTIFHDIAPYSLVDKR